MGRTAENTESAEIPCEDHDWSDPQSDAEYCWRRRCRRCGKVEGQRHSLVYAKIVTGCCVQVYVCEGCGYIPN